MSVTCISKQAPLIGNRPTTIHTVGDSAMVHLGNRREAVQIFPEMKYQDVHMTANE